MKFFHQLASQLKALFKRQQGHLQKVRLLHHQQQLNKKLFKQLRARKVPSFHQIIHVHHVLSPMESNLVRLSIITIIGAVAFILYANILHNTVAVPTFGGQYIEGNLGTPSTLNPIFSQSNIADQDIVRLMYNGLIRFDKNYNIIPDLAESWIISEDFKTLTMKIRSGVSWHDGTDFSADDVVATYQAIQNPDFKSPLLRTFSGVKVEKTDEDTVIFTLPNTLPRFISNLSVGILQKSQLANGYTETLIYGKSTQQPVGTGPYRFESMEKDNTGKIHSLTLVANKDYYLKPAHIEKLVFKYYIDYPSEIEALKNKQLDGLGYIPKDMLNDVNKHDLRLITLDMTQFTAVFFNTEGDTLLKKPIIRQALILATNKTVLLEDVLRNQGHELSGPILPGLLGYDENIKDEFNPSKALEILKADGWIMNSDGVLEKKKTPLAINLTIVDLPDMQKLGALLKDQWQQIGVKVNLIPISIMNLTKETLQDRNYEALVIGEVMNVDGGLFPFWHSSQRTYPGLNISQYMDSTTDSLLEKTRLTNDSAEIAKLHVQIQNAIRSDMPAIFLYTPSYSYPISTSINTVPMSRLSLPSDRLWTITDWYIKTKQAWK